jgi:hypothetical protein
MPPERQQRNQTIRNTLQYQQQQQQRQKQQTIMRDISEEAVVRGDIEFELFDFDEPLTGVPESSMAGAAAAATASDAAAAELNAIDECDANDHDAIINHPRRPNVPGQQAWLDLRGRRRIIQDPEAEKLLIEFQKTRRVVGSAGFFSPKLLYRVSKGEGYACRPATLLEIRKNVNAKRSKQQPTTNGTSTSSFNKSSPSNSTSASSSSMVTDSSSASVKPATSTTKTTAKINVVVPKATPAPPQPQPTFSKGDKLAVPVKSGSKSTPAPHVVVTKRVTLRRTILEFYRMLDELDQVPRLACEAQDFRKTMDSFLSLPYTDVYPETPVAQQGYHVIHDAVQILWEGLCKLYAEGATGMEDSKTTLLPKHSNSSSYKGVPTQYRGRDEGGPTTSSTIALEPGRTAVKSRRVSGDHPSDMGADHMEESALSHSDDDEEDSDAEEVDEDGDDEEEEETMSLSGSPRVRRRRRRSGGSNSKESPKGAVVRRSKKRRAKMKNAGSQRPDPIDVNSGHQTLSPGRASADEVGSSPYTLSSSGDSLTPSSIRRDRKHLLKAKSRQCPPAPFVNDTPPRPSMIKTTATALNAAKPIKPVKTLKPQKSKSADAACESQATTASANIATKNNSSSPSYMLLRKTPKPIEESARDAAPEIPSAYRAAFEKLREQRLANELLKSSNGTAKRESALFLSDWKTITLPLKKHLLQQQMSQSEDDDVGGEGEEALKRSGRRAQIKVHGLMGGSEHSMGSSSSKFKMILGGSDHNDSTRDWDANSSHSRFNYRQW